MIEMCIALALCGLTLSLSTLSLTSTAVALENSKNARQHLEQSVDTLEHSPVISYLTPCEELHESTTTPIFQKIVANFDTVTDLGNDCGGSVPIPSYPSILQNQIKIPDASTLDVVNGTAFVGTNPTATTTATGTPTFFVFKNNSTDLSNAITLNINQNIKFLDATYNYVYVAAIGTSSQVHIIDVRNKDDPKDIAKATLPGVTGSFPSGNSIRYFRSRLYVGVHRTAGREFHIYDVATPAHPVWLGSIELNHNVNDIQIAWPYAYLATSGNTKDIMILDISSPTNIREVSAIAFMGNEDSLKLFLMGNYLYAGRAKSNVATEPEFNVLDISNPLSPILMNSKFLKRSVTGVCVIGNKIFTAEAGVVDLDCENDKVISLLKS